MDALVVSESLHRATQLYYRFIRHYELGPSDLCKHRHEVVYHGRLMRFISGSQLDICLQGRHDPEIIHGPNLEKFLDKAEGYSM